MHKEFEDKILGAEQKLAALTERLPKEKEMPPLYRTLSDAAIQSGLGVSLFQVNNDLHMVRLVFERAMAPTLGRGERRKGWDPFAPPEAAPQDAGLAFLHPVAETVPGADTEVRVIVLDAAGSVHPLATVPGVTVVKRAGVGEVVSPAPHRFRGEVLDDRYLRLAIATVRSAVAGEMRLGLEDAFGCHLDASSEMTVRFRARP